MNRQRRRRSCLHQRGASLVFALVTMALILMLGIGAVGSSNSQFMLAGNLQFDNNALNNAEMAVSSAEAWLSTGNNGRDPGFAIHAPASTPYLYPTAATDAAVVSPLATTFTSRNSKCIDNDTDCASSYVIQLRSLDSSLMGSSQSVGGRSTSSCGKVNTYQIIGRGRGGRGASRTVVSYFSVLSCLAM